jgi:hypothetical protein
MPFKLPPSLTLLLLVIPRSLQSAKLLHQGFFASLDCPLLSLLVVFQSQLTLQAWVCCFTPLWTQLNSQEEGNDEYLFSAGEEATQVFLSSLLFTVEYLTGPLSDIQESVASRFFV